MEDPITEVPTMKFNTMSSRGVIQIVFDQDMLTPDDPSEVDYSTLFEFEAICPFDGSSRKDKITEEKIHSSEINHQRHLLSLKEKYEERKKKIHIWED